MTADSAFAIPFDHQDPVQSAVSVRRDYQQLLAQAGPTWSDAHGGFWVLTRYEDVRDALTNHEVYSSAQGVSWPANPAIPKALAIEMDPPEHAVFRKIFGAWLTPRVVRMHHPIVEELTQRYVGQYVKQGGGDFVREVSARLPVQVITRLLGIDSETAEEMYEVGARAAHNSVEDFFRLMEMSRLEVESRRAHPRDDLLTASLSATINGLPISDEVLVAAVNGAIFAGHDTTLMAGAALIKDLADDQELQQSIRAEPELIPALVEESLRISSPVSRFFRTLTRDVTMGTTTMRAGDKVMVVFGAANIDERQFPEPLRIALDRERSRHVSFGWGIHRCVGASLAQHELQVLAEVMVTQARFWPDGPARYAPPTAQGNFLGLESLPLSLGSLS